MMMDILEEVRRRPNVDVNAVDANPVRPANPRNKHLFAAFHFLKEYKMKLNNNNN